MLSTYLLRALPVRIVIVPPLVGRGLGVALRRFLPRLLATECGDVEVVPGAPHGLVTTAVDEIGAKYLIPVTGEGVRAVPLVHSEVGIEVVGQCVPGDKPPAIACLQVIYVR